MVLNGSKILAALSKSLKCYFKLHVPPSDLHFQFLCLFLGSSQLYDTGVKVLTEEM